MSAAQTTPEARRRATDRGTLCRIAWYASAFWRFIDRRQIDAYAVTGAIMYGTVVITSWAMDFVDLHPEIDGMKSAAVIAAVMTPWSALQAAAVKFLFDARRGSFETPYRQDY